MNATAENGQGVGILTVERLSSISAAQLSAIWKDVGSGLTDAQLSQTRIPLGRILTVPQVFQPRMDNESSWAQSTHVRSLMHRVRDVKMLDPVTVLAVAGLTLLVDGHQRVEAYRRAGVRQADKIAVRYLRGSVEKALLHSVASNSNDTLNLTRNEKRESAWSLVRLNEGLKQWSGRLIAVTTGVSHSTVKTMVKTLGSNKAADGETDVRTMTWQQVLKWKRGEEVFTPDPEWDTKLKTKWTQGIRKLIGPRGDKNPEVLMRAVEDAYPNAVNQWFQQRLEDSDGDVEMLRQDLRAERGEVVNEADF